MSHACQLTQLDDANDIYITDPPYGDAVKYEEILEFFIAWLRKNPPPEFADWIWDSRRSLAIKGEDEDFRRGMVAAYKRMTECMPDNGIQVIMFTHQSGTIWADMANIVWASACRSLLPGMSSPRPTAPCARAATSRAPCCSSAQAPGHAQDHPRRSRLGDPGGGRGAGAGAHRPQPGGEGPLPRRERLRGRRHPDGGYAAALRVLTRYAVIDGRDMTAEAIRPRVKGETTFVDGLIAFAVDTANQCLVPQGIRQGALGQTHRRRALLSQDARSEAAGPRRSTTTRTLPRHSRCATSSALHGEPEGQRRTAQERGRVRPRRDERRLGAAPVVLRAVLYAVMELVKNVDGNEVLATSRSTCPTTTAT